jgi:hypothetical protein
MARNINVIIADLCMVIAMCLNISFQSTIKIKPIANNTKEKIK